MSVYREKSRSAWMELDPPFHPPLAEDVSADIVVVGSGIAGLSTAYELAVRGAEVVVVDGGPIARGMSARTSAHLTSALDDFYHEFIRIRGEETAKLHFSSQAEAIDRIGEISEEEGIDCDFARLTAYLFLAGKVEPKVLRDEREALSKVGLRGATVESAPAISHKLSSGPCLVIPDQGRFHPLKYLDGLARAFERHGGRLFASTRVTAVQELGTGIRVLTDKGQTIDADAAVIATNSPINDRVTIHTKQAPYRTYVLTAEVEEGAIDDALYWDTEDPYHYVRLHPFEGGPLLLIGGEDHKSGTADDAERRLDRLEQWARQRFPEIGEIRHRWSGQVMDTIDYAAFIGLNPGNSRIYIATGDSGQGITHGVVAGMLLSGLIDSGDHPWSAVYAPGRKPMRAAGKYFAEGVDALKSMAGHILPGEIDSADELAPGSGGILREGVRALAVCRDESGKVHRHSATCTHVGCVIHWNSFEQCWDCPCHGSHFAPDGTALNAPAIQPLAEVKESARERAETA